MFETANDVKKRNPPSIFHFAHATTYPNVASEHVQGCDMAMLINYIYMDTYGVHSVLAIHCHAFA